MNLIYSLYVLDTETTSLDEDRQDIIELSMYRMNDNSQKTWRIKATNPEYITEDALRVNGHKREDILHHSVFGREMYLHPEKALPDIENWMMMDGFLPNERVFIAHNALFDLNALRKFWRRHGSIETFPFGDRPLVIDTRQIEIFMDVAKNSKTEYYNLGYLVEKYKIGKEKAHTAAGDVLMTRDLVLQQLKQFGMKK